MRKIDGVDYVEPASSGSKRPPQVSDPLAVLPHTLAGDGLKETVLFAGAGVSREAKYPSWEGLIRELVQNSDPLILDHSLKATAKYALDKGLTAHYKVIVGAIQDKYRGFTDGEERYRQLLKSTSLARQVAGATHKLLVRSGFHSIQTTNYDQGFEIAAEPLARKWEPLGANGAAERSRKGASTTDAIVHLHGSIEDPDSMILSTQDYRRAYYEKRDVRDFLSETLRQHRVFFVGVGFGDEQIMEELMTAPAAVRQACTALVPHDNNLVPMLRFLRIETVPYLVKKVGRKDDHSCLFDTLQSWFGDLAGEVGNA